MANAKRMICHMSVMHTVCECDTSWTRGFWLWFSKVSKICSY